MGPIMAKYGGHARYGAIQYHNLTTLHWVHSVVIPRIIFGIMQLVWELVLNIQRRRSFLVVNRLDQWRGRASHYPRDPRDAEFLLLPGSHGAAPGRVLCSIITGFLYSLPCDFNPSSMLVLNLISPGNGHMGKKEGRDVS
jgi:hypothetical protein